MNQHVSRLFQCDLDKRFVNVKQPCVSILRGEAVEKVHKTLHGALVVCKVLLDKICKHELGVALNNLCFHSIHFADDALKTVVVFAGVTRKRHQSEEGLYFVVCRVVYAENHTLPTKHLRLHVHESFELVLNDPVQK